MHLIRTTAVFGAGWVVGARAGRERYEQVAAAASLVAERPEVRRVTQPVIAFFTGADDGSGHRAPGQVQKALGTVRQQAVQVAGQVASKVSSGGSGSAAPAVDASAADASARDTAAAEASAAAASARDAAAAAASAPMSALDADPGSSRKES